MARARLFDETLVLEKMKGRGDLIR